VAEVTTKAPEAPAPRATSVIPTDGFHDSREVAVAEAQGLPTSQGYPLQPAAQEALREIRAGLAGVRQWIDYADQQLARATKIGAG
jgi:hypothetical protein